MAFNAHKYAQNLSYSATDDRHLIQDVFDGEGILEPGSFRVTANGTNMVITTDPGRSVVRGDTDPTPQGQGLYLVDNPDSSTVTLASDPGNPRITQIVLQVRDSDQDGGVNNDVIMTAIVGTPTAGATLDNRNGVAALPSSCLLLADVLVGAGATSIPAANVRDRRSYACKGIVPAITSAGPLNQVMFEPVPGFGIENNVQIVHASHDLQQSAVLMYLPRRIVGATKIRTKYLQGATALAGSLNIGIYDASGRLIVSTGTFSYNGALNTFTTVSATITATTFEAGLYYVVFGNDSTAGDAGFIGIRLDTGTQRVGSFAPNVALRSATGGVTLPTTILSFTDVQAITSVVSVMPVPLISISTA